MFQSRVIRKLTFGVNPLKEGIAFVVGHTAAGEQSGYKVSTLEEDNQSFLVFGVTRYNVFITQRTSTTAEEEVLWKSFWGVPVAIEYFLPGEIDLITV